MRPTARPFARSLVPTALAALAIGACANGPAAPVPTPPRDARAAEWAGDTLRLPFGATAALPGGSALAFVARGDDSRCPIDALCVWEGDASVTVRVVGGAGRAGERTLHTSARYAADTITAGGTRLRLFGVLPARRASAPPAAGAVRRAR
jgi:hypothetical protein